MLLQLHTPAKIKRHSTKKIKVYVHVSRGHQVGRGGPGKEQTFGPDRRPKDNKNKFSSAR